MPTLAIRFCSLATRSAPNTPGSIGTSLSGVSERLGISSPVNTAMSTTGLPCCR
ncbi:Uncharacterised protein [Segatella copri]|nr:Uncharacterised protein [Segatella copri]